MDPEIIELHETHALPLTIKSSVHIQPPLSSPIEPTMLESHGMHASPLFTKLLAHIQAPFPSLSELESIS